MKRVIVPALFFFLASYVFSATAASAVADYFDRPCARYNVPKSLALAVAQTESSMYPWTVNVAGRSFQLKTKDQALALVRFARARRLSHDIGLMQVNNWWLDKLGISPDVAIEPANNVLLGVWILAKELRRHGFNWKAVGAYHSPTPARQARYAAVVARHYRTQLLREKQ